MAKCGTIFFDEVSFLYIMRKAIVIMMLLCVAVAAQGQGRGRPWKRGELRLEDFGVVTAHDNERSHLDYGIVYSPSGVTEGNNSYLFCRTAAVMYPTASWIDERCADTAMLAYNQMLFDVVEVYRRQMQQQGYLLSATTRRSRMGLYERLQANTMEQLEREMQELRVATEEGRDSAAVERVRVKNREWLNAHPCDRPDFTLRSYWWSLGVDYGFSVPTGGLARHYTASVGMQGFTAALGWGRHGFYYRTVSGSLQTYDTVGGFSPSDYRIDLTFGYGFTLIDRPNFSITPYIAYGASEFAWWVGENYTFGISGSYHFFHWHRITNPARGKAKRLTASATGNLYLNYVDLGDDRKGLTFGLQVGIAFLSRNEKVTW